jgi:hypothetical protein
MVHCAMFVKTLFLVRLQTTPSSQQNKPFQSTPVRPSEIQPKIAEPSDGQTTDFQTPTFFAMTHIVRCKTTATTTLQHSFQQQCCEPQEHEYLKHTSSTIKQP